MQPKHPVCASDNQDRPNRLVYSEMKADRIPDLMRMAFSVRETAKILGVSDKTVRRLIDQKLLRASRAIRHLLIPKKEIDRFLQETSV
jgi:excisionase family DNA binding protein